MEAWFHAQARWHIVPSVSTTPTLSTPIKDGEEDKLEAWQVKADKAAGIMWLMVDSAKRVHFRGIKDDAVKMWKALEVVQLQKWPGTRFNAYDDLFSIRKCDQEDLQSLINQVDDALHHIRNLRALPDDYNSFVSSLLLKDNLDKTVIQNVFVCGDT